MDSSSVDDKQTIGYISSHNWLMSLAIDLAATVYVICGSKKWHKWMHSEKVCCFNHQWYILNFNTLCVSKQHIMSEIVCYIM